METIFWDTLSQSNKSDDNVIVEDRFKFVDDLTILEIVDLLTVGLASYNIKQHVPLTSMFTTST